MFSISATSLTAIIFTAISFPTWTAFRKFMVTCIFRLDTLSGGYLFIFHISGKNIRSFS